MEIRFWGVRGSIAAPGPDTMRIGGNTSCVEVQCGATRIILDAGTGLRRLGEGMLGEGRPIEASLLLSHFHWDHIQGLPFFVPAYLAPTRLSVFGPAGGHLGVKEAIGRQMSAPHFPVGLGDLGARIDWNDLEPGARFALGDATVTVAKLNHPGGVLAYRVEHEGEAIVYATDTEHYACIDPALRALAEGAAILIYDAQYTPDEYAGTAGRARVGWGHSTFVAGAEVARAAGVRKLVLFHHDPQRTDDGVRAIEEGCRELFEDSVAAYEGMTLRTDDARGGADRRGAKAA
ncbi:MAG: MBL fold metallo-hydrolase [Polyangiaceae bacterium]